MRGQKNKLVTSPKKPKTKPGILDRGKCCKEQEQDLVMGWV